MREGQEALRQLPGKAEAWPEIILMFAENAIGVVQLLDACRNRDGNVLRDHVTLDGACRRRTRIGQRDIESAIAPEPVSQILQSFIAKPKVQSKRRSQLDIILNECVSIGESPRAVKKTWQIDRLKYVADRRAITSRRDWRARQAQQKVRPT